MSCKRLPVTLKHELCSGSRLPVLALQGGLPLRHAYLVLKPAGRSLSKGGNSVVMVCLAMLKYVVEKPLTLMACNIILSLIVPIAARLAGNNDPEENAISHVFGQGSICVAMDFPGWMEAATTMFFFSGLLHGYAIVKVYQHCKNEWQGRCSKICLVAFTAFMILCVNCFWLVGIFSPVLDHSIDTVFAHSIPYVALQISFWCWAIFLMAFVRPVGAGKCRTVSWCHGWT